MTKWHNDGRDISHNTNFAISNGIVLSHVAHARATVRTQKSITSQLSVQTQTKKLLKAKCPSKVFQHKS